MPPTSLILAAVLSISFLGLFIEAAPSCGLGQFLRNGACRDCPPGTYQDETGATRCKPCLPGTYNPYRGAQGIDVCVECPEGTFQNRSRATSRSDCIMCPLGKNSPKGSPACSSCPAGQFITNCDPPEYDDDTTRSFRGNCFVCYYDSYGFGCTYMETTRTRCEECPVNKYSGPNENLCRDCPEGTFSDAGASTCTRRPCPSNTFFNYFGACQQCNDFLVLNEATGECEYCPLGYIGNSEEGSTRCVPCPAGTYKDARSTRCHPCGLGENSNVTGAQICLPDDTPCPPNFFRNRNGACWNCSRRQRLDRAQQKCVDCPRNYVSDGGIDERCARCPRNMVSNTKFPFFDSPCVCRPGFGFVEGSGGTRCRKCPAGTEGQGFSFCRECSPQTIAPRRGMRSCIPCPEGMAQPGRGQRRCIRDPPCPSGTILTRNGCVEPHTNCPPNTRRQLQSLYQLPLCHEEICPAGLAIIRNEFDLESDRCDVCDVDHRFNPQTNLCEYCGANQISPGGLVERCQNCPPGFTNRWTPGSCSCKNARRLVSGKCSKCPRGTFGFSSIDGCRPCPAGTTSALGRTFCRNCTAGTFTDEPGQASCRPCPEGTTSFGAGDSGCVEVGSLSES